MSVWRTQSAERRAAAVLGALSAVVVLCGTIGYLEYLDDLSLIDALYFALGLLVLTFYPSPTGAPVPLLLDFARLLGVAVASGAVLAGVLAVLGNSTRVWRSRRLTEHVLVLGGSPLAVQIALAHRGDRDGDVVLIGEVSATDAAELRRKGVRHLDGVSGNDLVRVAAGARTAVVALPTDAETLEAAGTLLAMEARPGRVQAVIQDSAVAHRMHWPAISRGGDLNVLCVAERISAEVLGDWPPNRPGEVNAPPIVIGAGEQAAAVLRSIVMAWSLPGDPMHVWAMGPDVGSWVRRLGSEVSEWGTVHVLDEQWSPSAVGRWVREARAQWHPVVAPSQREVGPLVVVVGLDDSDAYIVAAELSALDLARPPVVVADRPAGWESLLGVGPDDLEKVSTERLLTKESITNSTALDLLARELERYRRLWWDDMVGLFGVDGSASFEAIAPALPEALRSAGLDVRAGSARFVFLPQELSRVVAALESSLWLSGMPTQSGEERRDRLFDLVAMVPLFLTRTGQRLVRVAAPRVLLDDSMIETMAIRAHQGYTTHVEAEGNATGSDAARQGWDELSDWRREQNLSQARDVTVKVAIAGLDLAPLGDHSTDAWAELDPAQLEQLAIHEHRRWEFLHRLAGWMYAEERNDTAKVHNCLLPWDRLDDDTRGYDRSAVAQVPSLLASVGLQAVAVAVDRQAQETD